MKAVDKRDIEWRKTCDTWRTRAEDAEERAKAAEAERDRLREELEALRKAVVRKPYGTYNSCLLCGGTWWDDQRPTHWHDCAILGIESRRSKEGGK